MRNMFNKRTVDNWNHRWGKSTFNFIWSIPHKIY